MNKRDIKPMETGHADRFDQVSQHYIADLNNTLSVTGSDADYFYQAKIKMIKIDFSPAVILDFGCGIGILSRLLADAFPHSRIIGVDPSTESIEIGKKESITFGDRIQFFSELDVSIAFVIGISCILII